MKKQLLMLAVILGMTAFASAGVNVSQPVNGATVTSPTRFVATATGVAPISAMRIYVDGTSQYLGYTGSLDTNVTMADGTHSIVVQAWDTTGAVYKTSMSLNVAGTTTVAPQVTTTVGVNVTSPANNSTVSSPAQFVATATSASGAAISAVRIYVDGVSQYLGYTSSVNTPIAMSSGAHSISVQAWDTTGAVYVTPLTVNVGAAAPVQTLLGSYDKIEELPNWENCTVCAGANANGPVAQYSMIPGYTSPAMDGNSTQFWIGGSTPYADAIWWKQLGGNDNARNFTYDVNFYITDPQYAQGLEFDANQSAGGRKFIYATQCNIRDRGTWDVWDTANVKWVSTGIPCSAPPAYQWNHVTWEFKRTDTQVTFVSLTYNGVKYYVNMTFNTFAVNASEINVAFQMDGDYAQHQYKVWLDQVSLKYW